MGEVLVELGVLGLADLVARPGPQRLARVDGGGLGLGALLRAGRHDVHADGPGDEVGVAADDLLDLPVRGVVVERVLLVHGLEVQRHGRALRRLVDRLQGVGALAGGLPAGADGLAGATTHDGDPVGDHEAGVEADSELADQFLGGVGVPRLPQFPQELGGAGLRDGAEVLHEFVTRHPDPVVAHGEGALFPVGGEVDVQVLGVDVQVLVGVGRETQLVERVGRVRDQLAQEDVLARVDGVHHQSQELASLGLELEGFRLRVHWFPFRKAAPRPRVRPPSPRHQGARPGRCDRGVPSGARREPTSSDGPVGRSHHHQPGWWDGPGASFTAEAQAAATA